MISICLTIHNKGFLLEKVLRGIFDNCAGDFEIICLLDACTDDSEKVLFKFLHENASNKNFKKQIILYGDNLFETKANNRCMKQASGEYICIVQDDQIITEYCFDVRLTLPFKKWSDVFAVTGRCAHSWRLGEFTENMYQPPTLGSWSKILEHCDHAQDGPEIDRSTFYIRDSVNRGPLVMKTDDVRALGYLDEVYAPLMFDEHDLMFRARKELGKTCGYFHCGWRSEPGWGGTRNTDGTTKQWALDADFKNSKIFAERWAKHFEMKIENRKLQ